MTQIDDQVWRKCTTCKKPIFFGKKYWICSVSTCNRVRTDLVFCDLRCFDAHVPVMNHRDAGAFEKTAPKFRSDSSSQFGQPGSQKQESSKDGEPGTEGDILVVVSKVKAYIRARSGMNTGDSVMEVLSQKVRGYSKHAIEEAKKAGRSTVMGRDF